MSRRRSVRRARRIPVTFWKRGDDHGSAGYTTNISTTGMFLGTGHPLPPGTRVRVEVLDREHGFVVEGVVAHARRMRGEMNRIAQSGMGVRFLGVEELVRELIPAAAVGPDLEPIPEPVAAPETWPETWEEAVEEVAAAAPESPAAAAPPTAAPPPPSAPPVPPPGAPAPPAAASPAAPVSPAPGGAPAEAVWTVRFASPRQFVQVYDRDLVHGGLFVATHQPARVQEVVTVEVHLPLPNAPPVRLRARVVQRFEPRTGGAPNLLAGMGVELLEPAAERLRPVADLLRALPD